MNNELEPGKLHQIEEGPQNGHMPTFFNETQIEVMRDQFAHIDHVTTEHWKRIRVLIENSEENRPALHQLSISNIKFLSGIVALYLRTGVLRRP